MTSAVTMDRAILANSLISVLSSTHFYGTIRSMTDVSSLLLALIVSIGVLVSSVADAGLVTASVE